MTYMRIGRPQELPNRPQPKEPGHPQGDAPTIDDAAYVVRSLYIVGGALAAHLER